MTRGQVDFDDPFLFFDLVSTILTAVFGETVGPIVLIGLMLALIWNVVRGINDPRNL